MEKLLQDSKTVGLDRLSNLLEKGLSKSEIPQSACQHVIDMLVDEVDYKFDKDINKLKEIESKLNQPLLLALFE